MSLPERIEGYAIISADGMIADANGEQPPGLLVPADQRFFHRLARARAARSRTAASRTRAATPRRSASGSCSRAASRRSRRIRDTRYGLLWNPAGASLEQAWSALDLDGGVLGVIGGTDTFGYFLDIGYDAFHLTRADRVRLPGGRPVFPAGSRRHARGGADAARDGARAGANPRRRGGRDAGDLGA